MVYFDDLEFLPETEELFSKMVEASLASVKPSGRLFLFLAHGDGNTLAFRGPPQRSWDDIDEAALNDLVSHGLLQLDFGGRGTPNYRISNEGHRYYRFLQERRGTPLAQVDATVQSFVQGEEFARRYPKAMSSLGKATGILWTGELADQAVSEFGAALRAALQDFAVELFRRLGLHSEAGVEKPIDGLRQAVDTLREHLGDREPAVLHALVDLADVVLREIQRIHHVRDEGQIDKWDELRRAAFVLTFLMYEIDHAAGSP